MYGQVKSGKVMSGLVSWRSWRIIWGNKNFWEAKFGQNTSFDIFSRNIIRNLLGPKLWLIGLVMFWEPKMFLTKYFLGHVNSWLIEYLYFGVQYDQNENFSVALLSPTCCQAQTFWKLSVFLPQNSLNIWTVVVSKPSTFLIVFGIINLTYFTHCGIWIILLSILWKF